MRKIFGVSVLRAALIVAFLSIWSSWSCGPVEARARASTWALLRALLLRRRRPEIGQPAPDDPEQALAFEPVMAAPPFSPHLDQTGLFQHPEVARRGGPAMLETRRQIARGQLAAQVAQDQQDVPARPVRKRQEHRLGLLDGERRSFHA